MPGVMSKMNIPEPNPYGTLNPERLAEFEAKLGYKLPSGYREFLISCNGGKPEPYDFEVSDGADSLHHVYGLHDGPNYAQLDYAFSIYYGRMPQSMIPIADDPCGNAICIGVTGDQEGRVFFWDHEFESDDGLDHDNITSLAESFEAFCESLFAWVDPDETEIDVVVKNDDVDAMKRILESGVELEHIDEYGRTMIERAAIKNSIQIIQYLHSKGAKLRTALELAQQNAEFFPDHKKTVDLIVQLGATNET